MPQSGCPWHSAGSERKIDVFIFSFWLRLACCEGKTGRCGPLSQIFLVRQIEQQQFSCFGLICSDLFCTGKFECVTGAQTLPING